MKLFYCIALFLIISLFQGCFENPPAFQDGNSNVKILAIWNKKQTESTNNYLPLKNANIIMQSEYGTQIKYTNESGWLMLQNLPESEYSFLIRTVHPEDNTLVLVGSVLSIQLTSGENYIDTIIVKPYSNNGITINEIYYSGPVNDIFYVYDQFIELYNSSDSVKYLDGIIIIRFSGNTSPGQKGPGADEGNDGDIDGVSNIYKFPGEAGEKNYPFFPKTFIIIASDAINHKESVPGSIDLSNADWEFYNQYSVNDIDNPSVPNLINLRPDITADFQMNLNSDIIVISKGRDKTWEDGIDISDIIDGVEYKISNSILNTLDSRIDKSAVIGPPRYSGKSIQRQEEGMDSNNSSLDFIVISKPTPDYQ
jgi:hypothetical protein